MFQNCQRERKGLRVGITACCRGTGSGDPGKVKSCWWERTKDEKEAGVNIQGSTVVESDTRVKKKQLGALNFGCTGGR